MRKFMKRQTSVLTKGVERSVVIMKGLITILIMAMLFVTSGCGTGADYSSEEITTEAISQNQQNEQEEVPRIDYNFDKNPYYQKDNHNVVVAEDGYYFVRNTTSSGMMDNFTSNHYGSIFSHSDVKNAKNESDERGKIIYYYDINTQKVTPLCSKINCGHNSEECEAYFGDVPDEGFVYYNKHLYMRTYDETAGLRLVSYDKNGKNKKEECVISADPEYQPCVGNNNDVCILNDKVYSWAKKNTIIGSDAGYEIVLYKTDIKSGKTDVLLNYDETLLQYKATRSYTCDIQVANNELYAKICTYDEKEDMYTFVLYKIDEQSGKLTELLKTKAPRDCNKRSDGDSYAYMRGFAVDTTGNVFFVDELSADGLKKKVKLCRYNIAAGDIKDVYDMGVLISYCVMCDDDKIYLDTQDNDTTGKLVILDKEGNHIYSKEFSRYGRLLGLDDRYVVVSLMGGNDFKDDPQDSGWTECYRYAILQKDTIGTGNEKWKQMYNGMIRQ